MKIGYGSFYCTESAHNFQFTLQISFRFKQHLHLNAILFHSLLNGRCHYLPEDQKILPNHSSLLFFYFCSEKKANSVPLGNSYFAVTSYECMSTANYQWSGSFVKTRICAFVIYFIQIILSHMQSFLLCVVSI